MRRVALVTGATGLIGRHTLAPLRDLGFEVHGLARLQADLRDPAQTRAALDAVRPTHILHCAWDVTHGRFWHAPENLDWVAATLRLGRLASACGVERFVGVGSCAEYDWTDGGTSARRETDPTRPATLYGLAKNATRELLAAALPPAGVSFAWGRVFDLFGAGEAPGRLVASLLASLRAGRPFVCRHGQLERDYMDVRDVGAALAHLTASDVAGPVNIASGKVVSLAALTTRAAALLDRPDLLTVETVPLATQPQTMRADVTRLRQDVGAPEPEDLWQRLAQLAGCLR
jgi:nucleoside-diphosphate-sugar epimerase